MFVPRALRLKGVREPQKPDTQPPAKEPHIDDVVAALEKTSTSSPLPETAHIDSKNATSGRGPRFTVPAITTEYLGQLLCGVELIFTDYAHQDKDGADWLEKRYRVVEGEEKCTFAIGLTPTGPNLVPFHISYDFGSYPPFSHSRTPKHLDPEA